MKRKFRHFLRNIIPVTAIIVTIVFSCRKPTPPSVPDPIPGKYDSCFVTGTDSTLDIVTFNVQQFPKMGEKTIEEVAILIEMMEADIIAFQEISSTTNLSSLDDLLEDYTALAYPIINSEWNLAYLYRHSEITIDASETKIIFGDDYYSFPRPPFEIHATHLPSSTELILLNNHFKCCGGTDNEDRRRSASEKLHSYVETNYPSDAVIVLGDLNDEIDGSSEATNVFWDFVNDPDNYSVADMPIATGSSYWWSYPSWPSHIDHIIISDELFSMVDTVLTIRADKCYGNYSNVISDHRPVYLRLK